MPLIDENAKAEKARRLFLEGYSCAQSVFAAFAPEMGLDEKQALRIASGMGGGIGGLRLTCGAVTAMTLVLGALRGYAEPGDTEGKKALYARVQELHRRFVAQYGTSNCGELLEKNGVTVSPVPSARTPEYYRKRPCGQYVEACARLICQELNADRPAAKAR